MIFISFARWSIKSGSFLTYERLYNNGKWTFLVRVKFRYLKTVIEIRRGIQEKKLIRLHDDNFLDERFVYPDDVWVEEFEGGYIAADYSKLHFESPRYAGQDGVWRDEPKNPFPCLELCNFFIKEQWKKYEEKE